VRIRQRMCALTHMTMRIHARAHEHAHSHARVHAHVPTCAQVKDNQVSRKAYRLARHLLRLPSDLLVIVHILPAHAATSEATALLASFSHIMTDAQTARRAVHQVGGTCLACLLCRCVLCYAGRD